MLVRRMQIAVVVVVAVLGVASAAWAGVPSSNERHVQNVYRCELFRDPADPAGKAFWTNQLDTGQITRPGMANAFVHSDEWRGVVVTGWYFTYLNREPDSGVTFWMNQLATSTVNEVEPRFAASAEAYANGGGTNSSYIDFIYNTLLGRSAEPAGQASWGSYLASGGSRAGFVRGVFNSDEAFGVYVDDAYGFYLERTADAGGRSAWVSFQKGGKSIADLDAAFLGSDEFYQRAVAAQDACNSPN
jgi:hypothetical protein